METRLGARALLDALQAVERRHGRVRDHNRWGPRVLDLDLLLFGEAVIDRPGLRVPHPELAKRAFVLLPLADVAPGVLPVPGHGTLGQLLAECPGQKIRRLGPPAGCEGKAVLAESPACLVARPGIHSPAADGRENEPSQ
jgi:2-amino-4-hydroxy-6-hydroxymethyldihydropteridine diphosphokinase